MLTLSTNPRPDTLQVRREHSSTRSALKNKKRMGEMGDPCGMPVVTRWAGPCQRPSTSEVWRSARKLAIHRTITVGKPFLRRLCSTRLWETWLKAPAMSRLSSVATLSRPWPHTVWICSVSSSSAVEVSRCRRHPCCAAGSRWYFSAM